MDPIRRLLDEIAVATLRQDYYGTKPMDRAADPDVHYCDFKNQRGYLANGTILASPVPLSRA